MKWFMIPFILFFACGPSIKYSSFVDSPVKSKPENAPIKMFATTVPECEYTELGIIFASGGAESFAAAMQKKVREIGNPNEAGWGG